MVRAPDLFDQARHRNEACPSSTAPARTRLGQFPRRLGAASATSRVTNEAARETQPQPLESLAQRGESAQAPPATRGAPFRGDCRLPAPDSPWRHGRCGQPGRTGHDRVNSRRSRPTRRRATQAANGIDPIVSYRARRAQDTLPGDGGGTACLSLHHFLVGYARQRLDRPARPSDRLVQPTRLELASARLAVTLATSRKLGEPSLR